MKKMLRENKLSAVLSSVVTLLPVVFGLIVWDKLPGSLAIHWNAEGADGFASKAFAVFGLPLILLAVHWLGLLITNLDPKAKTQSKKITAIMFWIVPAISLISNCSVYYFTLGNGANLYQLIPLICGLAFIILGNYLPKVKQNFSFGIKVPWALHNEENWGKTQRFGGYVFVGTGLVLLVCTFLPERLMLGVLMGIIALVVALPTVYSYLYHRKQVKRGEYTATSVMSTRESKVAAVIGAVIGTVVLAFAAVMMVTGNIRTELNADSFTVQASYYGDMTVSYKDIDSVEYRDDLEPGRRTNGFGSPRLSMGNFYNDEFGGYIRYTYTKVKPCVVLKKGDGVLVLGGQNEAQTKELFEALKTAVGSSQ